MKYFLLSLIALFVSCSSNKFVGSNNIPSKDKDIIEIVKEGYSCFESDTIKADSLFNVALILSEEIDYPYTNYYGLPEFSNKIKENKAEDWNGSFQQKVYTILKVYNGVRLDYASLGVLTDFDWKDKIIEFFPRFIKSKDVDEYTNKLRELISLLNDNHTRINFSKEYAKGGKTNVPPLDVHFLDGKFIITKVDYDSLKNIIYPGLEIISVDGIKPLKVLEDYKKIGFFSKIEKENNYKSISSLKGKEGSNANLLLYDKIKDKTFEIKLKRDKKNWYPSKFYKTKYFKEENILYFKFNSFNNPDSILIPFRAELKKYDLSEIKGMIFDVRENKGGNSYTGNQVISHVIKSPIITRYKVKISRKLKSGNVGFVFRSLAFFYTMFSDWYDKTWEIEPNLNLNYNGKIAVLISGKTGSAAEDFVALVKDNRIGNIYGEPSCGSTGEGVFYSLPLNNFLRVCAYTGIYTSGEVWQGKGILPDIYVNDTIESLMENRDPILEKAIEDIIQFEVK